MKQENLFSILETDCQSLKNLKGAERVRFWQQKS